MVPAAADEEWPADVVVRLFLLPENPLDNVAVEEEEDEEEGYWALNNGSRWG